MKIQKKFYLLTILSLILMFLGSIIANADWIGGANGEHTTISYGDAWSPIVVEWNYSVATIGYITEVHVATMKTSGWIAYTNLYVNNVDYGHPTYGTAYINDSYWKEFNWSGLNIPLNNEQITFEMLFTGASIGDLHALTALDLDADGDINYKYGTNGAGATINGIVDAPQNQNKDVVYSAYIYGASGGVPVVTTIGSAFVDPTYTFQGYLNRNLDTGYYFYGFEINQTNDFTINQTFLSSGYLTTSSFFNLSISTITYTSDFYMKAIVENISSGAYYSGSAIKVSVTEGEEYTVVFTCSYNTSNCILYNNYITFRIDTTPDSGIYWILDNSTDYNVSEGAYTQNFQVHTLNRWIDQDYGTGEWNLWVIPYDYYLSYGFNYSYAYNYSFCVSAGTARTEFINVEKEIYYSGDQVNIEFKGVNGQQYYIKIWPSGDETNIIFNSSKTGTGTLQTYLNWWTAQRYDLTVSYDVFYVWVYNATSNSRVSNVEDSFRVYTIEEGVTLNVKPTTIREGQSVTISGSFPFDKDDVFLKIELEDVWVSTLVVDNKFSQAYKCNDYGNYSVTMMYVGHEYISRNWYVIEEVSLPDYYSGIPAEFRIILGAIIIMIFVCIPLILMRKAKIKNSAIMEGIVASMMFLGMGFSTAWGLIPEYILPSALLIFAIVVFLVWFSKRQREG